MGSSVRNAALAACLIGAALFTLSSAHAVGAPVKKPKTAVSASRMTYHANANASHETSTEAARTLVYIPTMASDGKGFISQFSMDENGNLNALHPPVISAGAFPYSVAVAPSGKYCYAALWTDPGNVEQFTIGADGTLAVNDVPRVHTGPQPYPIAFTPDGALAVIPNNADGTIGTYRVDGNGTLTSISTAKSGKESRSVVVDPSGGFVYAGDYDSESISVYALASTGELLLESTVPTGKLPYDVALCPSGKYLYCADRGSGDVMVFSVNSGDGGLKLVSNAPSGTGAMSGANWITFDPAGKYAYVTNFNEGTVSQYLVDNTTGQLTRNGDDVKVGTQPIQIAIDPSGQFAFVANSGDNSVSELHIRHDGTLSTGAIVRMHGQAETEVGGTLHLSGSPWTIAFAKR